MGVAITAGSGTTMAADEIGSAGAPTTGQKVPYQKLDFGAAGSSSPVTVSNPLPVGQLMDLISVTLSLDTAAYASADLLADAQEIASVAIASGGRVELVSLMVIDEDDQKAVFDVYITSSSTSWGTENSAPTISDATARSIQAIIPIAVADYDDLGGVAVAQPRLAQSIGVICETSGSTSLYIAVVNGSGTPTYTASGVRIVLGFKRCD